MIEGGFQRRGLAEVGQQREPSRLMVSGWSPPAPERGGQRVAQGQREPLPAG